MNQVALTKNFINICSVTFKAFDYSVSMSKNKTTLWHFIATSSKDKNLKQYAVMCAPNLTKSKALIKVARGKTIDQRLVVVTSNYSDDDLEKSRKEDYCLVSIVELKKYGDEMLSIRERESEIVSNSDEASANTSSFVDKVIKTDSEL